MENQFESTVTIPLKEYNSLIKIKGAKDSDIVVGIKNYIGGPIEAYDVTDSSLLKDSIIAKMIDNITTLNERNTILETENVKLREVRCYINLRRDQKNIKTRELIIIIDG